ncbi:peptidylprolyl isomerase fpr4 [Entophlyctis luteolus]|nr:peptidylprolyl isomerase fpr4 [Entophlyctis luteolus]
MTAIAFWGLTCEPETGYSQLVEQSFRLTNIAIDPKTTAKNGTRVSVSVQSGNNQFTIANLLVGSVEQCVVDLTFSEGEEISFTVVGSATVHLTGNYIMDDIPNEDDDDEDDEDGDEDEEEDEDEDEEIDSDDEDDASGMDVFFNEEGEAVDADGNPIDISELIGDDEDDEEDDEDIDGEDDDDEEAEAEALAEIQKALDKKRKSIESKKSLKKPKIEELPDSDTDAPSENKVATNEKTEVSSAASGDQKKLSKKEKKKLQKQQKEEEKPKAPEKPIEKSTEKTNEKQTDKKQKEKKEDASSQKKVTKHPNGMIIEEVVEGSGPIAKVGSRVGVRYVGKLTNGKVFDSSTTGKPFEFKLGKGEVIKGWDIGVNGMKVGGARKLTIPPALAYGAQGAPPDIPKNATLVFEVKLLTIK